MTEIPDLPEWPQWDGDNRRFLTPSRCPYPDCQAAVDAAHAAEPTLGWCLACSRPYEVGPFRLAKDAPAVDLNRRPDGVFCSYTGQRLSARSVLDWCEAGGEPGRSYSIEDTRGAVFGRPTPRRIVCLERDWDEDVVAGAAAEDDDYVSSVSVVRGRVVAVTARGSIGLFDATTGARILGRPLEWPTGSAQPSDRSTAVSQPPALRGTHMVLAAAGEAHFRDLRSSLFPSLGPRPAGRGGGARLYPMVEPGSGLRFLGPPLGVDGLAGPTFCLLEGSAGEAGVIEEARLRFFDETGKELARCPVPGIARPPVFDRRLECVLWVDSRGTVSMLPSRQLGAGAPAPAQPPDPVLDVGVDLRPTFAVTRNAQGRSEAWLSTVGPAGEVDLHRTLVEPQSVTRSKWRWQTFHLANIGDVTGFAVGIGSGHPANAAGQLIAVATDRQVLSLDRSNPAAGGRMPMTGPEAVGILGSRDVPLVCSAGVVARLQGRVGIDCQGLGWSDESASRDVEIGGLYREAQGMAMFGRRVYIGHAMGVRCLRIVVREVG